MNEIYLKSKRAIRFLFYKHLSISEQLVISNTLKNNQLINFHDKETFISKRNKAIIDFMYSTGCRVSELCDVKIADIDFDEDYIQLTGKGSKQRIVPIGSKLKTNLLSYLDLKLIKDISNNPFLFISRTDNQLERTAIFRSESILKSHE